jgi:hypothetical protein
VEGSPPPFVSRLWRTARRPSGVSWWGERPAWIRHFAYWAVALGVISLTAFDETTGAVSAHSSDVASLAWFVAVAGVLAIMGLVVTLLEWEQVGAARNISRSLVLFAFLLGFVAAVLFYARRWGVHIEACRTVGSWRPARGKHRHSRCLACWPGMRPMWCQSWISPTRWNPIQQFRVETDSGRVHSRLRWRAPRDDHRSIMAAPMNGDLANTPPAAKSVRSRTLL